MRKYLVCIALFAMCFGLVTWAAGDASSPGSSNQIIMKPNPNGLKPGSSLGEPAAKRSIVSGRVPGKIPAGFMEGYGFSEEKMDERPANLFFPQVETLVCDDGVLWDVDYNGVEEWNEAVRLTASAPCSLIALLFWPSDPDSELPNLTWGVWDDDGPGGFPSTLLDTGTETPSYDQWFQVDLGSHIFVPIGEDIYIGWLDINGAPYYVNGLDAVLDSCNYWYDGVDWVLDTWFEGDFMIRGICEELSGAYKDVRPTSINEPAVAVPQGISLNPTATIENLGSGPATFDIICNIDSLGPPVLVYSDTVHMTALAGSTDTAVTFPRTWNAANAPGIYYQTTVYTMLNGDDNPTNDTLSSTTVTYDPSIVIQSPYTLSPPTVDGFLTPAEWSGATTRDVSDLMGTPDANDPFGSATIYVMNDANNLYMAVSAAGDLTVDDFDQIAPYFDDNNDHVFPSAPDTSEGNYWLWKITGADSVSHRWIQAGGVLGNEYLVAYPGAIGDASGHQQFELQIPLGTLAQELNASAGDTVGFFILAINGFDLSTYSWWPYDTDPTTGWYTPSEYGDIILESAAIIHDGGVVSIDSPLGTVCADSTYTPCVTVVNFGTVIETFDVDFSIPAAAYAETTTVSNLAPSGTTQVCFPDWAVPSADSTWYAMQSCAYVPGDTGSSNDCTMDSVFAYDCPTVFHDVGVIFIDSLPDTVCIDSGYTPCATVVNFGSVTETFVTDFNIPASGYAQTESIFNLGIGATTQVCFANWTVPSSPDSFWYVMSACAYVPGDTGINNDCVLDSVFAIVCQVGIEVGWRELVVPTIFALGQNSPNPFNHRTDIRYQIPARTEVSLEVYDLGGRLVRTLVEKEEEAGYYVVVWSGRDDNGLQVPSGVYLYRMKAGESISTRKLILVR